MKAYVVSQTVANTVVLADVHIPTPGAHQLLVRMRAIGVGIHDSYFLPPDAGSSYPVGIEGAGVVEAVGNGVDAYRVGDRIAFVSAMQSKGGTWAEFAVVDADALIMPMPDGLDFAVAAALPVAGNTVLRAFSALGDPSSVDTVFVAGGAGAIGTLAIQVGRSRGWRVGASASPRNHAYLRSLGAELTVDYHDPAWPTEVLAWVPGGVDAAVSVHPGTSEDTIRAVRDDGQLVSISGDNVPPQPRVHVTTVPHGTDTRQELTQLLAAAAAGTLHVEIAQTYAFSEAPEALSQVQTRHTRGKLVLRLD